MTEDRRFDTFENMAPVVRCHEAELAQLFRAVRHLEKVIDTHGSPWWKRALFLIDGWGPWWVVRRQPKWRPWRSWFRS